MAFFHFNSDDKANLFFNTHTDVALLFLQKLFTTSPPPPTVLGTFFPYPKLYHSSHLEEKKEFLVMFKLPKKRKTYPLITLINNKQDFHLFIYLFIHSCKEKVIKQILPHAKNFRKYRNCLRYIYIKSIAKYKNR